MASGILELDPIFYLLQGDYKVGFRVLGFRVIPAYTNWLYRGRSLIRGSYDC